MTIKQISFPDSNYFKEEHPKKQIYLHHTAGNSNAEKVFSGWASNSDKIATCVAISASGQIVQGFSSKHWAYHLGVKKETFKEFDIPYTSLDRTSIGIEICNWGQLVEKNNKYYNYLGTEVPSTDVYVFRDPFKGFTFYHNYTSAQINSVKELLLLWKDKYNIPIDYSDDIFDITPRALKGVPGVYTHNSVRRDKVDVYPHKGIIDMLKSL